MPQATSSTQGSGTIEGEACWICLEEGSELHPVTCHCACPRPAHRNCLARWQIQQVGRAEEHNCRFCHHQFPRWSDALLPAAMKSQAQAQAATATMAVMCGTKVHKIEVRPGPNGEAEFKAAVKTLFGFPPDMEFDVTFEVKLPTLPGCALPATSPDSSLVLRGFGQYTTAATCAQASAMAWAMKQD